ncbi:MAG TPA: DUF1801 domain-containing protein [Herpetosiphonaceae bacterium]
MDSKVAQFAEDLSQSDPVKAEIVAAVRSIYREAEPALEERFIYGGIGMFLGGELVGGIFAYANHVTVEFSVGDGLADPGRLLEGKGKSRRHLKLRQAADIAGKTVASFVSQTLGKG